MMKQFKKLILIATTAFLFCLTVASSVIKPLPVPSITIETEQDTDPAPLPTEPEIKPMADEDEGDDSFKIQ